LEREKIRETEAMRNDFPSNVIISSICLVLWAHMYCYQIFLALTAINSVSSISLHDFYDNCCNDKEADLQVGTHTSVV